MASSRAVARGVIATGALVLWCGCGQRTGGFPSADASTSADVIDAGPPPHLVDGTTGGPPPGCKNLQCKEVVCPAGRPTTITGTALAPRIVLPDPIYDAIVYVPNEPIAPFTKGVACEHCGTRVSGSPVALVLTGSDGRFAIENAPAGDDIPLVIQMGRWRRSVVIPHVTACATTEVSPELTHLPRTKAEGDIPQMAIASGKLDPMECLLRKIGIDDSEFTLPTSPGRVHFYVQNGMDLGARAPAASTLWSDLETLERYDIVLLPCEGEENLKPAPATQNVIDYTSAGGRLFTTHFGYVWIDKAQAPFPSTAAWDLNQEPYPPDPLAGFVDTSFAKGKAMADWLRTVGASTSYGQIEIHEPREDVNSVKTPPSQGWISSYYPPSAQHFSFDTPIGASEADQCGKVVFSDFHVVSNETTGSTFPIDCVDGPLTAQEKVLEFMFFDLASCVQDDGKPPVPPPLK
jgi:hypothetical protein